MESNVPITPTPPEEAEGIDLFEGCGREGPIRAIFLSEFHHIAGPRIVYQYPPNVITKEIFDAISSYIIPKSHLQRLTITVNALGKKILGFPISIDNPKYFRNAYYFNTCFVCDAWARTVQYEQVLVKFAEFFHLLESESQLLSRQGEADGSGESIESKLEDIFRNVLTGLNGPSRECSIIVSGKTSRLLKLKVVPAVLDDPPKVKNHQVPVFVTDVKPAEKWDLTTQQLIPYIDGFNHVARIGQLAEVDTNLIKVCLQNLLYYKVIKIVPIFQYSNTYVTTPEMHSKLIVGDPNFKTECIEFVARLEHALPHFGDITRFYCDMKRGVTIKDLCTRYRTISARPGTPLQLPTISDSGKYSDHSLSSSTHSQSPKSYSNPATPIRLRAVAQSQFYNRFQQESYTILNVIDERQLVLFGLVHGLLRRIEKFPVLELHTERHSSFSISGSSRNYSAREREETNPLKNLLLSNRKKHANIYDMFTGEFSYDEICLSNEISQADLDELIEKDPEVVVIWK